MLLISNLCTEKSIEFINIKTTTTLQFNELITAPTPWNSTFVEDIIKQTITKIRICSSYKIPDDLINIKYRWMNGLIA